MRRWVIVAAIVLAWWTSPAAAGDSILWWGATGVRCYRDQPWQANDFVLDSFANRLCYNYGCYFRGDIGGKVYHAYYPGIYRYYYQHRYHRIIPYRYGLFSKFNFLDRHFRPYGHDFTTTRFAYRPHRYRPPAGHNLHRQLGSNPVRTRADMLRSRLRRGP